MSAADSGVPASAAADRPDLVRWLGEAWGQALAQVLESIAGERPAVSWDQAGGGAAAPAGDASLRCRQEFDLAADACAWASLAEEGWRSIGVRALGAAGVDEAPDEDARSTCQEILTQSFALLAGRLAERVGRPVAAASCRDTESAGGATGGGRLLAGFSGGAPVAVDLAYSQPLLKALAQPQQAPEAEEPAAARRQPVPQEPVSPTLDLLRDVELPVSISFGRAQMPLLDVLKLAAGSVIELDRTIGEPVSLVVNSTVVALGEVVVIEGNYGVRIKEIMCREKLLRSSGLG